MNNFIQPIYLGTAILLILGIRKMSSPKTAKNGITYAGWGMLIAIVITFLVPTIHGFWNHFLIIAGIAIGTYIGWSSGNKVQMINMPQMIALYNGMGGGAAGAIAAIELLGKHGDNFTMRALAVLGAIIGTISFSGSIIAFAKLQDLMKRVIVLPKHQMVNMVLLGLSVVFGCIILFSAKASLVLLPFFIVLLILGVTFTIPIGGANMPVVISLFNAMTGLAVGFEGFVLNNYALIVAGTVVGASGTLLTQLMAKAMNKSVSSILFSPINESQTSTIETTGSLKPIEVSDAAVMMAYSNKVIIIPGYGMAVAQAQHKIWELAQQLESRGVTVKFAIHPVAGRMPGHMNVLLAEAGVPYDKLLDLEEINSEFPTTDTVLVIGANDVVNPSAKTDSNSPIYGMPILDAALARNVLIIKRGQGKGFSGVENSLFTMDNSRMLYGDGQDIANKLVHAVKAI
ncbi:MAG: NAD(P)(+) transhydrogenase (Re/Si-specific) subunit beta [Gammaproteobacteria bacterium]|jgi:NAD(P) transhydrogenase subunit beta|nr:NAD(P)(+) transhydrogenase (Re/Si-specific) subunit beta [Gammaproteobacteria bacterium]